MAADKKDYILELVNITKKYPGVTALNNVSFKVKRGQILGVVGENGAGKSTLLKIISGVIPHNKYQGNIKFNGVNVNFSSIKDSEKSGIAIIHQELAISPFLSVYENIYVGSLLKNKAGFIKWNEIITWARYYTSLVGLKVNLDQKASSLSAAEQQLLEIAKALSKKSEILILDEPTSSLNDEDAFALLDIIKKLRDEKGLTCIFVSHKLKEIKYVADSITVLRDGQHIASYDNNEKEINEDQLIKDIVGRELSAKFPPRNFNKKIGSTILEISNYQVEHHQIRNKLTIKNADLFVREGEIVGLSGLIGAGRSELLMNIFGRAFGKRLTGDLSWKGQRRYFFNPGQAIKKGLMYISEDRKNLGLVQIFSVHTNINMAAKHIFANKLGIINKNQEIINSLALKQELNIKVPSIEYNVETLSGGNQQKVLIAKALSTNFDLLIIDEPTRGIDVGSKLEIYKIIKKLAEEKNKAIILISSEIEELLGVTDRIYIMSEGIIKGQLPTSEASMEKIMKIAIGTRQEGV